MNRWEIITLIDSIFFCLSICLWWKLGPLIHSIHLQVFSIQVVIVYYYFCISSISLQKILHTIDDSFFLSFPNDDDHYYYYWLIFIMSMTWIFYSFFLKRKHELFFINIIGFYIESNEFNVFSLYFFCYYYWKKFFNRLIWCVTSMMSDNIDDDDVCGWSIYKWWVTVSEKEWKEQNFHLRKNRYYHSHHF